MRAHRAAPNNLILVISFFANKLKFLSTIDVRDLRVFRVLVDGVY